MMKHFLGRTLIAVALLCACLTSALGQQAGSISNPRPLTSSTITGALGYAPAHAGSNSDITKLLGLQALTETYTAPAISAGSLTIDLSAGTVFNVAGTGNLTTFTISNAVAGRTNAFTVFWTGNGTTYTQAWGGSVKWAGGAAPFLTSTNAKSDVLTFITNDGGTTWFGFLGGQNF